jgi:hypothetical protein
MHFLVYCRNKRLNQKVCMFYYTVVPLCPSLLQALEHFGNREDAKFMVGYSKHFLYIMI